MTLEPPGSLPDQPPQLDHPLLVDGDPGTVLVPPAGGDQPDAEVEIIGQASRPWPAAQ